MHIFLVCPNVARCSAGLDWLRLPHTWLPRKQTAAGPAGSQWCFTDGPWPRCQSPVCSYSVLWWGFSWGTGCYSVIQMELQSVKTGHRQISAIKKAQEKSKKYLRIQPCQQLNLTKKNTEREGDASSPDWGYEGQTGGISSCYRFWGEFHPWKKQFTKLSKAFWLTRRRPLPSWWKNCI